MRFSLDFFKKKFGGSRHFDSHLFTTSTLAAERSRKTELPGYYKIADQMSQPFIEKVDLTTLQMSLPSGLCYSSF